MNPQNSNLSEESGATAHLIAMTELENGAATNGTPPMPLIQMDAEPVNPLRHVSIKLTVNVGSASLTVGELLGARAQQVIRLDREVEHPVDVLLDGQVVARGTLVAVDGHFAVRVTELPMSLDLGVAARAP